MTIFFFSLISFPIWLKRSHYTKLCLIFRDSNYFWPTSNQLLLSWIYVVSPCSLLQNQILLDPKSIWNLPKVNCEPQWPLATPHDHPLPHEATCNPWGLLKTHKTIRDPKGQMQPSEATCDPWGHPRQHTLLWGHLRPPYSSWPVKEHKMSSVFL
jgi:hypothetical protein